MSVESGFDKVYVFGSGCADCIGIEGMTRYKKGGKIEVLSKKDVLPSYWRCAELICGNGRTYTIRYDNFENDADDTVVERVSRKTIRPCPPELDVPEFVPGDIVEVFDEFAWKLATISKVLEKKNYLVQLLGSFLEFKVSKSDIRVRQSWEDGKWIVLGKRPFNAEEGKWSQKDSLKFKLKPRSQDHKTNLRMSVCIPRARNCINSPESHIVVSKSQKRGSPYCYSQGEAFDRTMKRHRVFEEDRPCQAMMADMIPFSRKVVSDNASDASSDLCSVGSCSINSNSEFEMPYHLSRGPGEDKSGNDSDAESCCLRECEERNCLLSEKELAAEIHRLELQAYHCTMEALHASGPLSWEQETLVTDLRLSLHISNDEHLMELRYLISGDSRIPS